MLGNQPASSGRAAEPSSQPCWFYLNDIPVYAASFLVTLPQAFPERKKLEHLVVGWGGMGAGGEGFALLLAMCTFRVFLVTLEQRMLEGALRVTL